MISGHRWKEAKLTPFVGYTDGISGCVTMQLPDCPCARRLNDACLNVTSIPNTSNCSPSPNDLIQRRCEVLTASANLKDEIQARMTSHLMNEQITFALHLTESDLRNNEMIAPLEICNHKLLRLTHKLNGMSVGAHPACFRHGTSVVLLPHPIQKSATDKKLLRDGCPTCCGARSLGHEFMSPLRSTCGITVVATNNCIRRLVERFVSLSRWAALLGLRCRHGTVHEGRHISHDVGFQKRCKPSSEHSCDSQNNIKSHQKLQIKLSVLPQQRRTRHLDHTSRASS